MTQKNQVTEASKGSGLTPGFVNAHNKAAQSSAWHTCTSCGFVISKYSGRYPRFCGNCGSDMAGQKNYPAKYLRPPKAPPAINDVTEYVPLSQRIELRQWLDEYCEAVHAHMSQPMIPWSPNHRVICLESTEGITATFSVYAPISECNGKSCGKFLAMVESLTSPSAVVTEVNRLIGQFIYESGTVTPLSSFALNEDGAGVWSGPQTPNADVTGVPIPATTDTEETTTSVAVPSTPVPMRKTEILGGEGGPGLDSTALGQQNQTSPAMSGSMGAPVKRSIPGTIENTLSKYTEAGIRRPGASRLRPPSPKKPPGLKTSLRVTRATGAPRRAVKNAMVTKDMGKIRRQPNIMAQVSKVAKQMTKVRQLSQKAIRLAQKQKAADAKAAEKEKLGAQKKDASQFHVDVSRQGWNAGKGGGGVLKTYTHKSFPGHEISYDVPGQRWIHTRGNKEIGSGTPKQFGKHISQFQSAKAPPKGQERPTQKPVAPPEPPKQASAQGTVAPEPVKKADFHSVVSGHGWQKGVSGKGKLTQYTHPEHPGEKLYHDTKKGQWSHTSGKSVIAHGGEKDTSHFDKFHGKVQAAPEAPAASAKSGKATFRPKPSPTAPASMQLHGGHKYAAGQAATKKIQAWGQTSDVPDAEKSRGSKFHVHAQAAGWKQSGTQDQAGLTAYEHPSRPGETIHHDPNSGEWTHTDQSGKQRTRTGSHAKTFFAKMSQSKAALAKPTSAPTAQKVQPSSTKKMGFFKQVAAAKPDSSRVGGAHIAHTVEPGPLSKFRAAKSAAKAPVATAARVGGVVLPAVVEPGKLSQWKAILGKYSRTATLRGPAPGAITTAARIAGKKSFESRSTIDKTMEDFSLSGPIQNEEDEADDVVNPPGTQPPDSVINKKGKTVLFGGESVDEQLVSKSAAELSHGDVAFGRNQRVHVHSVKPSAAGVSIYDFNGRRFEFPPEQAFQVYPAMSNVLNKYASRAPRSESSIEEGSEESDTETHGVGHPDEDSMRGTRQYKAACTVIFSADNKKILLGRSTAKDDRGGKWCFPGGHVDPEDGADLIATARREAEEEMGIRGQVFGAPVHVKPGVAAVLMHYDKTSPILTNEEFSETDWFDVKALPHDIYPINRTVVQAALQQLNKLEWDKPKEQQWHRKQYSVARHAGRGPILSPQDQKMAVAQSYAQRRARKRKKSKHKSGQKHESAVATHVANPQEVLAGFLRKHGDRGSKAVNQVLSSIESDPGMQHMAQDWHKIVGKARAIVGESEEPALDKSTVKRLAHSLFPKLKADEIDRGVDVEMEHTTDPSEALKIALDHLKEDPDYYVKLATIHKDEAVNNAAVFPGRRSIPSWMNYLDQGAAPVSVPGNSYRQAGMDRSKVPPMPTPEPFPWDQHKPFSGDIPPPPELPKQENVTEAEESPPDGQAGIPGQIPVPNTKTVMVKFKTPRDVEKAAGWFASIKLPFQRQDSSLMFNTADPTELELIGRTAKAFGLNLSSNIA